MGLLTRAALRERFNKIGTFSPAMYPSSRGCYYGSLIQ
jgi:hypothetical protein